MFFFKLFRSALTGTKEMEEEEERKTDEDENIISLEEKTETEKEEKEKNKDMAKREAEGDYRAWFTSPDWSSRLPCYLPKKYGAGHVTHG